MEFKKLSIYFGALLVLMQSVFAEGLDNTIRSFLKGTVELLTGAGSDIVWVGIFTGLVGWASFILFKGVLESFVSNKGIVNAFSSLGAAVVLATRYIEFRSTSQGMIAFKGSVDAVQNSFMGLFGQLFLALAFVLAIRHVMSMPKDSKWKNTFMLILVGVGSKMLIFLLTTFQLTFNFDFIGVGITSALESIAFLSLVLGFVSLIMKIFNIGTSAMAQVGVKAVQENREASGKAKGAYQKLIQLRERLTNSYRLMEGEKFEASSVEELKNATEIAKEVVVELGDIKAKADEVGLIGSGFAKNGIGHEDINKLQQNQREIELHCNTLLDLIDKSKGKLDENRRNLAISLYNLIRALDGEAKDYVSFINVLDHNQILADKGVSPTANIEDLKKTSGELLTLANSLNAKEKTQRKSFSSKNKELEAFIIMDPTKEFGRYIISIKSLFIELSKIANRTPPVSADDIDAAKTQLIQAVTAFNNEIDKL